MNPYRCVFRMGIEKSLEYRANFFLSLFSAVFPIIIQTFLWNYLYGNTDAAALFGYSYNQIIVYTLLAGLVSKLVYTGFEYHFWGFSPVDVETGIEALCGGGRLICEIKKIMSQMRRLQGEKTLWEMPSRQSGGIFS